MSTETVVPAAPESPAVEAVETQTPEVATQTPEVATSEQTSEPTYKSALALVQAGRQGKLRPRSHHSVTQPRAEDGKWTQDAAPEAASEQPAVSDDAGAQATHPADAADAASVESQTE